MEKLVAINLKTKNGTYKFGSVICGNDGSYYIVYPNNNWFRKTNATQIIPIKYSYHASGNKSRMTIGSDKKRVAEFAEEIRKPINSIETSEGMVFFSLFDVQNNIEKMLDISNNNRGYKEVIVIDSKRYKNITLRFSLANKLFSENNLRENYNQIFRIPQKDIDLIITTEDVWPGSNK